MIPTVLTNAEDREVWTALEKIVARTTVEAETAAMTEDERRRLHLDALLTHALEKTDAR